MIKMHNEIREYHGKVMTERLKSKAERELSIESISNKTSIYKKKMIDLVGTWKTNHQRLKFMSELLFAVFEHSLEIPVNEGGFAEDFWKTMVS